MLTLDSTRPHTDSAHGGRPDAQDSVRCIASGFAQALKVGRHVPHKPPVASQKPAPSPSSPASPPPPAPKPPASTPDDASAKYIQDLEDGNVTQEASADLTATPGTTVDKVMSWDHGLLGGLGDQKLPDGRTVKDAIAQACGYKDWNDIKSNVNAALKALGLLEADKNEAEADGSIKPDSVRYDGKIDAWTSHGQACRGGESGDLQDRLQSGRKFSSLQTGGNRVHGDGTEMSGAERIGHEIENFFKKLIETILAPIFDLVHLIQDAVALSNAEKSHDPEKIAEAKARLKSDAVSFALDLVSFATGPEGAVLGTALKAGMKGAIKGMENVGRDAGKAGKDAGKVGQDGGRVGGKAEGGAKPTSHRQHAAASAEMRIMTEMLKEIGRQVPKALAKALAKEILHQLEEPYKEQAKNQLQPYQEKAKDKLQSLKQEAQEELQPYLPPKESLALPDVASSRPGVELPVFDRTAEGGTAPTTREERDAIFRRTVGDFVAQLENPKMPSVDCTTVDPIAADALPLASRPQEVSA